MLSIIIITKNEQKLLPRLLKSVKEQSYKDYEVIVSDANSKDKTREIAKKFGCKIVNGGLPSIGRNRGAKIAKGNILLFLDADSILPNNFLEDNIKEFKKKKCVCATVRLIPISIKLIDKILYNSYHFFVVLFQSFYPLAGGHCIFCKRSTFNKARGFDENILFAEDHAFANKCNKLGKFRVLNSVPIFNDIRRFNVDGRWGLIKKCLYTEAYRVLKGEMYHVKFDYKLHGNTTIKTSKRISNQE